MKALEFENEFDEGQDVAEDVDWSNARRPNRPLERVVVNFPAWVVESLDREANRLGVTRESLVELWITERLDKVA